MYDLYWKLITHNKGEPSQFKLLNCDKNTEVAIRKCKCGSDTHTTSCSKYCPFNKEHVASNPNLNLTEIFDFLHLSKCYKEDIFKSIFMDVKYTICENEWRKDIIN